jgi:hypothetical protein
LWSIASLLSSEIPLAGLFGHVESAAVFPQVLLDLVLKLSAEMACAFALLPSPVELFPFQRDGFGQFPYEIR